jgi:hypothetical protein|tara:strand:+ start:1069 stop:1602 length:534 start_codon:yes stop_codon:yes gene_type:complete
LVNQIADKELDGTPVLDHPSEIARDQYIPVTAWVSMDEPAVRLIEVNENAPDSSGFRRYQRIIVVRKDAFAEYSEDLGPAGNYAANEIILPGGYKDPSTKRIYAEETVGSLKDIARQMRFGIIDTHAPEEAEVMGKRQYLWDALNRKNEHKLWAKRGRTFSGPTTHNEYRHTGAGLI